MRIIRRGTFETNSSSSHSITLVYPEDQNIKIGNFKGKKFTYKEFGYDFWGKDNGIIDDIDSKLNVVCDFLASGKRKTFPKTLDKFISYLKNEHDITVEINSKQTPTGRDNKIISLDQLEQVDEDENEDDYEFEYTVSTVHRDGSIIDKNLDNLDVEELVNFIFNKDNFLCVINE